MATLLDYRRRIRSVKSTQQITRAMKFVAAAKLRRAQEGVFAARPYAGEILRVLRSAAARLDPSEHPLLNPPEKTVLVIVLTGDRSLCGAFNANVIRRASMFLREKSSTLSETETSLPRDMYPGGTKRLVDYIYEQPFHEIFDTLMLRYVETQVLRILLESSAAEWAARMTAMDSATRNAAELIDKVTLQMNKTRQAAITKELIEIVSGAASATS